MKARLVSLRRTLRGWFPLVELEFTAPQRTITLTLPGTTLPLVVIREYDDRR